MVCVCWCVEQQNSIASGGGNKYWWSHSEKQLFFLNKVKYVFCNPVSRYYPREMKTHFHTKHLFYCFKAFSWLKTNWRDNTMLSFGMEANSSTSQEWDYHLAIQGHELLTHAASGMNRKRLLLSERPKDCTSHESLTQQPSKGKKKSCHRNRWVVIRDLEEGLKIKPGMEIFDKNGTVGMSKIIVSQPRSMISL